ncbi:Histidine triad nucleotide-binding protein 1 [Thelohanellus kitauei]|uniref:Histidine triad nucleotide-binding protein 1 n=1 Tax=Thelohanellus kitauei TaxID=669202 RepID=A0A0C2N3P9_THEKT|nr:Histidine triad nucleotide-binding protein 1 [Thelohanellus kitauei]KII74286.1 Histidine triad nucleotide-binding protein 1 [Thelohanellus kitauei]
MYSRIISSTAWKSFAPNLKRMSGSSVEVDSIFTQIIKKKIPSKIIYEDDKTIVIEDISPQAPVHLLAIPKKQIKSLSEVEDQDLELMGHLMKVIRDVSKKAGLGSGYRVVTNIGEHACQSVNHIHFHILGGKQMSGDMT